MIAISRQRGLTGWHLKRERHLSARDIENGLQSCCGVLRGVLTKLHSAFAAFMTGHIRHPRHPAVRRWCICRC